MDNGSLKKYLVEVNDKTSSAPHNAPAQRSIAKEKYSFSNLPLTEQLIIWDYVWNNSGDLWTCMQAFLFLEANIKNISFLKDSWKTIKLWQKKASCWGQCDALSKIYTKILEVMPDEVFEQLTLWNKSANPWDKRQSLVSLLYFSRTKKHILPYRKIISLINKVIEDEDYYVRKGAGWALKELYCVYPHETLRYLEDNAVRIPSTTFTVASEKLHKRDKDRLKIIRKRKDG